MPNFLFTAKILTKLPGLLRIPYNGLSVALADSSHRRYPTRFSLYRLSERRGSVSPLWSIWKWNEQKEEAAVFLLFIYAPRVLEPGTRDGLVSSCKGGPEMEENAGVDRAQSGPNARGSIPGTIQAAYGENSPARDDDLGMSSYQVDGHFLHCVLYL